MDDVAQPIEVEVHRVEHPERTGDPAEDTWRQYQVWGTLTNRTDRVLETASVSIVFHGEDGQVLGVDSIGAAVRADAGDHGPGETVLASVHFVGPGERVPFHFLRNLAAFDAPIASTSLHPRDLVFAAPEAPRCRVTDLRDERVDGMRVVTATLRNEGTGGCRAPGLVGERDEAGRLRFVETADATDDLAYVLAPGESVRARATLVADGDAAWRWSAGLRTWVDCRPTG